MRAAKYAVLAAILLLSMMPVSSIVSGSAFLCTSDSNPASCTAVNTHGPLISAVLFSVIPSDSSLKSALLAGGTASGIQGPEWTFTVASFDSLTSSNVATGSTTTYEFDGIGFNTVRPYMNNVYFRQAMAALTSYSYIQTTILSSIAGTAAINYLPCSIYPGACYSGVDQYAVGNTQNTAYADLIKAGLHPSNTTDVPLSSITNWYVGPGDAAIISNTHPACSNTNTSAACVFNPLFFYRSDDPLRTGVATALCTAASGIGLQMKCDGITGSAAGGDVYGESASAWTSPGSYNATTGYNNPPVVNSVVVNGSATTPASDTWDMYTFGWITSAYYSWPYYFFNSALLGTSENFVSYYNTTIDYYTNALLYTSTVNSTCTTAINSCGASQAAAILGKDLQQQLPYLMSFYEDQLYAVYSSGWTGYANEPSTGPDTSTGLYYTQLNVHQTSSAMGGTYALGLHQIADQSGLNPLYNTEWVWQIDIWGEIYDSPLAAYPTALTTPNDFLNYMTVGSGNNLSQWVQPFTGTTGNTTGWFQTAGQPHNITNGQVITFTFRNNITWTDNVPLTAYDYNYSLWAWDVTGDSGAVTPSQYAASGPLGLIATYINPSNPYQIKMYVGSDSVWNLANLNLPVLPEHILGNIKITDLATATGAIDLTLPSDSTGTDGASSATCGAGCLLHNPTWLQYLPNLEVGSGPFYLSSYGGVISGAGELKANTNYQRAAWNVIAGLPANTVTAPSAFNFNTTIQEFTYNPASTAFTYGGDTNSLASKATGYVGINNATTSIQLYNSSGIAVGSLIPMTASGTNGLYTASIPTASLVPGSYEIVANGTYHFLGLARTWYQASGFTVLPAIVITTTSTTTTTSTSTTPITTTTTTSSTTTSSSNTQYVVIGVIVVVIIIIIAAAALMMRGKPKTTPASPPKS